MWLEVLYWIAHVWSFIECVCCAYGLSERLDALSICFVCVFVIGSFLLIEYHRCLLFLCCFFV